ncbi:hypothetical protein DL770_008429 [Monosporascus sp. CRB-9-2]|nr:hypothetical protein DL770_008429 [Monosporascus sp. CRB-9-2]
MRFSYASVLPLFTASVSAWSAPGYDEYGLVWSDNFAGVSGSLPNENNWNIIDGNLGANNELRTYKRDSRQVQNSGGSTLQLPGKRTMAEAAIRFGGNSVGTKQNIWPAFRFLGNFIRSGTAWPACGELDIIENVNGRLTCYGTIHCHVHPGGICNEPTGRGATVSIPNQEWQRRRIVWDRTPDDWRSDTITWFMNDGHFHRVRGDQLGDPAVWASLAAKPLHFILNVAAGGDWVRIQLRGLCPADVLMG